MRSGEESIESTETLPSGWNASPICCLSSAVKASSHQEFDFRTGGSGLTGASMTSCAVGTTSMSGSAAVFRLNQDHITTPLIRSREAYHADQLWEDRGRSGTAQKTRAATIFRCARGHLFLDQEKASGSANGLGPSLIGHIDRADQRAGGKHRRCRLYPQQLHAGCPTRQVIAFTDVVAMSFIERLRSQVQRDGIDL